MKMQKIEDVSGMNFSQMIKDQDLFTAFKGLGLGIERECLRTAKDSQLAQTMAPKALGKRADHPYLITDFGEAQPEIITPPASSINETVQWLQALHDVYLRSLEHDEYLWPFSMPNVLPQDDEIDIIQVPEQFELDYRNFLADQYGKKLQMISGIHFNFSFSQDFLDRLYQAYSGPDTFKDFRDELYLKLTRNFLRYHWLITYLFGAAPYADGSFYESTTHPKEPPASYMRSLRNSSYGYHNFTNVQVPLTSVEDYAHKIQDLVRDQVIIEEREFYGDARLKNSQGSSQTLLDEGIEYVELRCIDIDPYAEFGISQDELEFIHLFLMAMVWIDEDADEEAVAKGNDLNSNIATLHPHEEIPAEAKEEGFRILDAMTYLVKHADLPASYLNQVDQAKAALKDPKLTLASQIIKDLKEKDYLDMGRDIGQANLAKAWDKPFLLRGFHQMEMSSQLLLFDAIQRGIEARVLDEDDQFLELNYKGHVEYVRNGNQTSKDNYISHWIMANKTVTKLILAELGYQVPSGKEYSSLDLAIADYPAYKNKALVVKPKSTNYGIGISIFKKPFSQEAYEKALAIAFKEDSSVLVEDYIEGTEYRFFVIDGKTRSVLLRKPANVLGDGKHTIKELIQAKNDDKLRGDNHRAPLTNIKMTELEALMLDQQGYDFDSVPKEGEEVYLRENSNISTGGDSLEVSDQVDPSYKAVAEAMAQDLEVKVSGIDLIIPDIHQATTPDQPGYTMIEMNFNPAMNMHAYVYEGLGRRLTQDVLNMLYPELPKRPNH